MMGTMVENVANKLLDFSQSTIDVGLLDEVVKKMFHGAGSEQQSAQKILNQLREHPDSWMRVDAILEYSQNPQTKFYALQILEKLVQTRWKALPREQCEGIKSYVVQQVIKNSSDAQSLERENLYLSKLNLVLVQIVKREWPKNWPSFITDLCGSSETNPSLCYNNMRILKLLSEEVFDFSAGQMTQSKAHQLKQSFCGEFQRVFELCNTVFASSDDSKLILATLETLLRFLNWIPLGYIFETQLINMFIMATHKPMFRNVALQCLTEISAMFVREENITDYNAKLHELFIQTLKVVSQLIPSTTNMALAYAGGKDLEQKFIANLAMFLCTFLKEHASLIDSTKLSTDIEALDMALGYVLKISEVEDVEIFKVCLEYWNWLTCELYRESPFPVTSGLNVMFPSQDNDQTAPRRRLYAHHLTNLRLIMVSRMAKPEEVLVVENEQGEVVRETIKDTDSINLYKTMRETLVYLTHLDYVDTERIMTEKLSNQVNGTEWSWKNLNTLCWAIGSISGAMLEEDEKRFLVTVIRDLLGLCEMKRGKDNKAVIASNIMYVVGQYPRFLRAHWKFLKTVVNKLFEFLHETHEGVQDMACDTFIKIAGKCKRHFVIVQVGETQPFIEEILGSLNMIICDLTPPQVHVFYEAVGILISAQNIAEEQEKLIEKLMALPNNSWDELIALAAKNVEALREPELVKNLVNILKTNVSACKAIGYPFLCQLTRIYMDMLNVYKVTSENISQAVSTHGQDVLKQPIIKYMRGVKTNILVLISTWVEKLDNLAKVVSVVLENFVPPLFEPVLLDYQRNVPLAREPQVLSTMTTFITKLEMGLVPWVPRILDAVFECTLDMINKDMQEFPEHRTNFFKMLQALNEHCFPALIAVSSPQFKLIMDSIIWAFKHSMRNVAEIGLDILQRLLVNICNKTPPEEAQVFFQTHLTSLLQHLLEVVTDASLAQVAGLSLYATILAYIFNMVETGKVTAPLNLANPQQSNMDYIFEYTGTLLKGAFAHLTDDQIRVIVKGFFSYDTDVTQFKEHLRDFLVQIKEFTGEDTSDLFLEVREQEIQRAQESKVKKQSQVPGILNPHEIEEEMAD